MSSRPANRSATKESTSRVRASLDAFSFPMLGSLPSAWAEEQKLPKPCVGNTATSSGSSAAGRCAEACWARARCSVSRGSTRPERPTVPMSREPPVKTAIAVPFSSSA